MAPRKVDSDEHCSLSGDSVALENDSEEVADIVEVWGVDCCFVGVLMA